MRHQMRWLLTQNERGGPEERARGTDALQAGFLRPAAGGPGLDTASGRTYDLTERQVFITSLPRSNSKEIPMADFTPPPKNSASPFADMRGHHVAVRTPSLAEAKDFYVKKLDFRVIAEWDYADEKLAYLAPPTDDHFYIEVLGGGNALPTQGRPYTDLGDSLKYRGYHHFCLNVR